MNTTSIGEDDDENVIKCEDQITLKKKLEQEKFRKNVIENKNFQTSFYFDQAPKNRRNG